MPKSASVNTFKTFLPLPPSCSPQSPLFARKNPRWPAPKERQNGRGKKRPSRRPLRILFSSLGKSGLVAFPKSGLPRSGPQTHSLFLPFARRLLSTARPSAVLILALPVPWWIYAIAQLPLLSTTVGSWIYYVGKAIPPALLGWAYWPALKSHLQRARQEDL